MKLAAKHPASIVLGVFALVGLLPAMFGVVCGDTLIEQVFAATAVPAGLVVSGLTIDRIVVAEGCAAGAQRSALPPTR